MYFLLNFNHYVKSYRHLCQILACFTLSTRQIWSCYVTQVVNIEKFKLWPNSAQISSRRVLFFRSYQPESQDGTPQCL